MAYLPKPLRAVRQIPQASLGGFWGDLVDDYVEFAKMAFNVITPAGMIEEKRLAEATDKAKADAIAIKAEKQVAAEQAARAELAARGGAQPPPPLTAEQLDLEKLKVEHQLRERELLTKGLVVTALLGVGGYFAWKKFT